MAALWASVTAAKRAWRVVLVMVAGPFVCVVCRVSEGKLFERLAPVKRDNEGVFWVR